MSPAAGFRWVLAFACAVPVFAARAAFADGERPVSGGEAGRLLARWCDGLIALQVGEGARAEFKGGVMCPACGFLHGRICDAVYPFAHLYATTGERKYLEAAEAALDWCERNMLLPGGLYRNDRQSTWRTTTAFFAISLWKALDASGARPP